MMSKNTQRTLKALRDQGYIAEVCERWIPNPVHPGGGFRKDLFGIIDIIAISKFSLIGVQSCGQDYAAHDRKIMESEYTPEWIRCAGLQLWGWRKLLKKKGGKQKIWVPRIKIYTMEDFEPRSYPGQ